MGRLNLNRRSQCAGVLSGALLSFAAIAATPYVPDQADAVVAELPMIAASPQIATLRREWQNNRADGALRLQLADAYLDHALTTGDARGFSLAQGLLEEAEESDAADQRLAAALRGQHRFAAAADALHRILARGSNDPQVWLDLAALRATEGKPEQSARACQPLFLSAARLVAVTCLAQAQGALEPQRHEVELREALHLYQDHSTVDVQNWVLSILAELAQRQGALDRAEDYLQTAVALDSRDRQTVIELAYLMLERGRAADVLELLDQSAVQGAELLRAAAQRQLGVSSHNRKLQVEVESARRRGPAGARLVAEYELLVSGDAGVAAEAAFANWTLQKGAADVWLAARAAVAANRSDQRDEIRAWLSASGVKDQRVAKLLAQEGA